MYYKMADMEEMMFLVDIQPESAHAMMFKEKPKKSKKRGETFNIFVKMCVMWSEENMLFF